MKKIVDGINSSDSASLLWFTETTNYWSLRAFQKKGEHDSLLEYTAPQILHS